MKRSSSADSAISDDSGRYSYKQQPTVCKWNCGKLAEALAPLLPMQKSKPILDTFDDEYERVYIVKMRQKVEAQLETPSASLMDRRSSLVSSTNSWMPISTSESNKTKSGSPSFPSRQLVAQFLNTMHMTGADFTNSFRMLSLIHLPNTDQFDRSIDLFLSSILEQCCDAEEWKSVHKSSVDDRQITTER